MTVVVGEIVDFCTAGGIMSLGAACCEYARDTKPILVKAMASILAALCEGLLIPHVVRPKVSRSLADMETWRSNGSARSGDRRRTRLRGFITTAKLPKRAPVSIARPNLRRTGRSCVLGGLGPSVT